MREMSQLAILETKLFFREKQAVFWTFLFPVLMLWLFGAMFGNQMIGEMSYSNAYIPSWIAINILTTSLFTIGTVLTNYREKGVLRRLQATPLRPWMVIAAHCVYGTFVLILSIILLLVLGFLFFDLTAPVYLGSSLLALALAVAAMFPFGLFLTAVAKNVRTASAISSVVLNLMLFLSGATFPVEFMPNVLQWIAKFIPLYYVVDLFRATWNFSPIGDNLFSVSILGAIAIISIFLSTKYFRWTDKTV